MEIQLAFDPHRGVNPADFVSQWQQTSQNRAIAQISLAKSPATKALNGTEIIIVRWKP